MKRVTAAIKYRVNEKGMQAVLKLYILRNEADKKKDFCYKIEDKKT